MSRLWQRLRRSAGRDRRLAVLQARRLPRAVSFPAVELSSGSTSCLTGGNVEALGVDPKRRSCTRPARRRCDPSHRRSRSRRSAGSSGQPASSRVRRMLGVWSFVYALLHLRSISSSISSATRVATCDFQAIWEDILKRRFIFVGMLAFVDPAAARDDVDERLDAAAQEELAAAPSAGLRRRRRRRSCTSSGVRRRTSASRSSGPPSLAVLLGVRVFFASGSGARAA